MLKPHPQTDPKILTFKNQAMFLRLMEYKEQKLRAEKRHDAVFEREQALTVRVSELESVYGRLVAALTSHYDLSPATTDPAALPALLEHLRQKLGTSLSTPLDQTITQQIGQLEEQNSRLALEAARTRPLEKENVALREELVEAQELLERYKRKITKYQLGFQMVPQAAAVASGSPALNNGQVGRPNEPADPSPSADGTGGLGPTPGAVGPAEVSPTESNEDLEDERTRSALRLKEIQRLQEDNRKLLSTIEELRQKEAEISPERVKSSFTYTALTHQLNAATGKSCVVWCLASFGVGLTPCPKPRNPTLPSISPPSPCPQLNPAYFWHFAAFLTLSLSSSRPLLTSPSLAEAERLKTELAHVQALLQKIKADHAEAERKVTEFIAKQTDNFSKQLSDIQNKIKAAEKAKVEARQDLELLKSTLPSTEYVNELKKQAEING